MTCDVYFRKCYVFNRDILNFLHFLGEGVLNIMGIVVFYVIKWGRVYFIYSRCFCIHILLLQSVLCFSVMNSWERLKNVGGQVVSRREGGIDRCIIVMYN